MSIKVRIPQPLQKLTSGKEQVEARGLDVKSLVEDLEKNFPGIKERLCDETGKIRRFINIYVNEEDIRFLQGDQTKLKDGDEVSIIPAIAGGTSPTPTNVGVPPLHFVERVFLPSPLRMEKGDPDEIGVDEERVRNDIN